MNMISAQHSIVPLGDTRHRESSSSPDQTESTCGILSIVQMCCNLSEGALSESMSGVRTLPSIACIKGDSKVQFFLILIRDIPVSFTERCNIFAAGIQLIYSTNEVNTVQEDLRQTFLWIYVCDIRLDAVKSHNLHFIIGLDYKAWAH